MSRASLRGLWGGVWTLAAVWRGMYYVAPAEAVGKPCVWPDCLTREQSDRLCAEILWEMLGEPAPLREKDTTDYRAACGCVESGCESVGGGEPPW